MKDEKQPKPTWRDYVGVEESTLSPQAEPPKNLNDSLQVDRVEMVFGWLKRHPNLTPPLERKVRETLERGGTSSRYYWTRAALEICHQDRDIADCLETLAVTHGFSLE